MVLYVKICILKLLLIKNFLLYNIIRFRRTWSGDKDKFILRFKDTSPGVADFDATFSKFSELGNKAQQVDTICIVEFLMLDCSLLKFSILTHIDEINTRLQDLLMELATSKLQDLSKYMDNNAARYSIICMCRIIVCSSPSIYTCTTDTVCVQIAETFFMSMNSECSTTCTYMYMCMYIIHMYTCASDTLFNVIMWCFLLCSLSTPPETLDNLGDSLSLLEEIQLRIPEIEKQFEPLQDQFNMLSKYEVAIPESVRRK